MKRTLLLIASAALVSAPAIAQELPMNGYAGGECFARVIVPTQYNSVEQIMIRRQDGTFEARTLKRPKQDIPTKTQWRQILCETDASPIVVRAIQQALQQEGFYDAPPDGYLGNATYEAVKQFQISRHLSTGGLTLVTVDALGVNWRSMVSGNQLSSGGFTSNGTATGGGFSSGTTVSTTGGSAAAAGGYTIGADGSVHNSAGDLIGTVNPNGEIVALGKIIGRVR